MRDRPSITLLSPEHDRRHFTCGVPVLDRYLAEGAGQDMRRRAALCYVAHEPGSARVLGYYTLAAGSVPLDGLSDELRRRLPRYPAVPVARIGRLAVALALHGGGLGAALLWDAALRAGRSELGVVALAVDAKDDRAASFYARHGFVPLRDAPLRLVLSLATAARA